MNPNLKKQIIESLAQVIADINSKEKALTFLKDFLTETDLQKLAVKLTAAHWITKNRDVDMIKNNLHLTSKELKEIKETIKKKGVKWGINQLEAEQWANKWMERINKLRF